MKIKKFFTLLILINFLMFSSSFSYAKAIDFTFSTYDGKNLKLSNFSGKYVLLNLFASYCPPCMIELKVFQKLHTTCSSKGLQVISLMIDREGASLLPKIVSSRGLTYPVGFANSEVFKIFKDFSITPTTYIIDPNGALIDKQVGYKNYDEWIKALSTMVKCN